MRDMELSSISDALVGTDETGGLSFEEKKRLSIAVELAASPSILFLDEVCIFPTDFCSRLPRSLTELRR
jgi:ABC-type multidrug transport system ATPase subunit